MLALGKTLNPKPYMIIRYLDPWGSSQLKATALRRECLSVLRQHNGALRGWRLKGLEFRGLGFGV